MLKELQIKNFAIIDDVTVYFSDGLNVLTGETGAGKTLIVEAINILIGERANSELIRDGQDKLIVQGFFDLTKSKKARDFLIKENLADSQDDFSDITITREVNRLGKNRAYINGIFTQVSNLKKLGSIFLDLHGQHDHQYLLDWQTHIDIIDSFGRENLLTSLEDYKLLYNKYLEIIKELNRLLKLQKEKEIKTEDIKFRINELEKLNLKENEEQELEQQKNILRNYEKIHLLCNESIMLLNGDNQTPNSLIDNLSQLCKNIEQLFQIDNKFERFYTDILNLQSLLSELDIYIKSYVSNLEFSSEKLDWIQDRLFKISEIKRKYNMSIKQVKEYLNKLKNDLENFENLDVVINKKKEEFKLLKEKLTACAINLSNQRENTIKVFKEEVTKQLKELNFKSVEFNIKHDLTFDSSEENSAININVNNQKVKPHPNGIDIIEFLISLNVGESAKPLSKIASGGEISRIMLALKSIISGIDNIITMIFDEIDVGIGGMSALIVGKKLYNISSRCQVICITHLPQIAAFADTHYYIDKVVEFNRTKININLLNQKDKRIKEISRMLSGLTESEISFKHAEELLNEVNRIKNNLNDKNLKGLKIGN